jgi:hypothetical protein
MLIKILGNSVPGFSWHCLRKSLCSGDILKPGTELPRIFINMIREGHFKLFGTNPFDPALDETAKGEAAELAALQEAQMKT